MKKLAEGGCTDRTHTGAVWMGSDSQTGVLGNRAELPRHLPGASFPSAWTECGSHSDFTTSLRTLRAAVSQKSSAPGAGDTLLSALARGPFWFWNLIMTCPILDPEPDFTFSVAKSGSYSSYRIRPRM